MGSTWFSSDFLLCTVACSYTRRAHTYTHEREGGQPAKRSSKNPRYTLKLVLNFQHGICTSEWKGGRGLTLILYLNKSLLSLCGEHFSKVSRIHQDF